MDKPQAPDPYATAAAQSDTNIKTATNQQELNMTDQFGPQGSLTYNKTGTYDDGTPKFSATTTLSPGQQALYDGQTGAQSKELGLANALLSSDTGALSGKPVDLGWNATAQNLNDIWHQANDPINAKAKADLDQSLSDRGITPGSEQYTYAQNQLAQQQAAASNQNLGQNYQTGVNTAMTAYNSPLQTASTLMTGSQPTMPTNINTPQTSVANTDLAGLVSNNYNAQNSQYNAMLGGMFGLGSAAIGGAAKVGSAAASDRRLKQDVSRIGTSPASGLPIYAFRYLWDAPGHLRSGHMADEVEKVAPWAVTEIGGFKHVYYDRI